MENKLRALFEYQKFEQNAKLAKLIDETKAREIEALSDNDLEYVSAARGFEAEQKYKIEDLDNNH